MLCHVSLQDYARYYYIRRIAKDRLFITQTVRYEEQALTCISSKVHTASLIYNPLCKYLIGTKGIIKYAVNVRSET